jgi:hypothetical protein
MELDSLAAVEIGQDQSGKLVAVAPLQNRAKRDSQLSDFVPDTPKISFLQVLLSEGIVEAGVESGRDHKEVGSEMVDPVECLPAGFPVNFPGRTGRDRVVEAVALGNPPRAGIGGEFVDGGVKGIVMAQEDVFGSVAVVDIEIEDCHAGAGSVEGGERADGGLIVIAESHDPFFLGMVARGAHETESGPARQGVPADGEGGSDREPGVLVNAGITGGIGIEIIPGVPHPEQVVGGVGQEKDIVAGRFGYFPGDIEAGLFPEGPGGLDHPGGPFGMSRAVVGGTARVVQDDHATPLR